jgi:hypothetical protein
MVSRSHADVLHCKHRRDEIQDVGFFSLDRLNLLWYILLVADGLAIEVRRRMRQSYALTLTGSADCAPHASAGPVLFCPPRRVNVPNGIPLLKTVETQLLKMDQAGRVLRGRAEHMLRELGSMNKSKLCPTPDNLVPNQSSR